MENTAQKKRGRPSKSESAKKTNGKSKNTKTSTGRNTLKPQGDVIFGLDIGTRTIVGIIGEMVDEVFCISDIEVVPHPKRAMIDGQIEDIEQVGKIVGLVKDALEKRNKIKLKNVSIAAAGRALHTKRMNMEFDVENKDVLTEENVRSMEIETVQEAQKQLDDENNEKSIMFYCVGHSVVSYKLDNYKMMKLDGHKGKKAEVELIAAFLPSGVVESLYSVMSNNNLTVSSLTLEPIAAMNVLVPPEIRLINIALVDIGAGTSDIAIARDGSIVGYAMATTAGDEITEEIIKKFLVDFNTAENMKMSCDSGEIEYRDIFMIPHKITTEEFYSKIFSAQEILAETICKSIVDENGESPQAIFLVGGGSRIKGLPDLIANKLSIDSNRVAVGGYDFLKNVKTLENQKLGPEFVTPIGICVTATMNQGYDFSVITLNDEKIRIFNTKEMSVFEFLTFSGYKSSQLMGRSGKSMSYVLNGEKHILKGEMQTPAEIYVNGTSASLNTRISQGDNVRIIPSKNGNDAELFVSEITEISDETVSFLETNHKIGTIVKLNGEILSADYKISSNDVIETTTIKTVSDLMNSLEVSLSLNFYINGEKAEPNYILKNGDKIKISENAAIDENLNKNNNTPKEIANTLNNNEQYLDTEITLNGEYLCLKAKDGGLPYLFVDLLNIVDIDQNSLQNGNVTMLHNSRVARFSEELQSGDSCIIK